MSDGYETEELTRIEAALDALVSPTSEDVFQATRPFDERAIASVAATRGGGGGGGGFVPARNVGQAEFDYSGAGEILLLTTPVALTYNLGDAALVDLTTPAAPKIVTAGVYAFTVSCFPAANTDSMSLRLLLDDNFYSVNAYSGTALSNGGNGLSVVWFCDTNDPFALYIQAQTGGVAANVNAQVFIQRLT